MELGLVWLLRAAWILGILPIIVAFIPSSRLSSIHGVVLGFAKRGKILPPPSSSSSSSSTSSYKFTVPQKFFLHFYLVAVVWTTVLLISTWYYAYNIAPLGSDSLDYSSIASHLTGGSHVFTLHKSHSASGAYRFKIWGSIFLLLLMEMQVVRRLYETIYVFKYSCLARMHIFGYLTGLFYYVAAPLSLCAFCAAEVFNFAIDQVAEFSVEGHEMMPIMEYDWLAFVKPITKLGWWQWTGAAIFVWGWVHQRRCHAILGSLRRHREQSDDYVIPHGDWFDIASSPHYLAEIIIYAGLLIASGATDLTIWLLFGFVVANLSLAAGETHRWYIHKFDDYPQNRRAILPFIY